MHLTRRTCTLIGLLITLAACRDDPSPVDPPPPTPTEPVPQPVGVYTLAITGLGTELMSSRIVADPDFGAQRSLTVAGAGLVFEQVSSTSFTEGGRDGTGQRYVSFTYRVRNGTGVSLNNLTILLVSKAGTVGGTALSSLKRFDGTNADSLIARRVVPTGAVALGRDLISMQALYPDVLQAYTEAEIAAISPPAGVTNIFPVGYSVRSATSTANRTLPATADPNQFDGVLTVSFRLPLQPTSAQDVFSFFFQILAVTDSETKLTESIEESQDTAAVRRLRDLATSLGATTVTVMNGSPVMHPSVTDYPGQRQICGARTAGTAGAPLDSINRDGAYSRLYIYRSGESRHGCQAYFLNGDANRPSYGLPFSLDIRAMDRYGNVRTAAVDTIQLSSSDGGAVLPSATALASGIVSLPITHSNYGTPVVTARGRRLRDTAAVLVAGSVRNWTGNTNTNWNVGTNWNLNVVPGVQDTVVFPGDRPNYPLLVANQAIEGVQMTPGASVQPLVNTQSFDFTINSSLDLGTTGTIPGTTGRVILTGLSKTVGGGVSNANFRGLRVTGTYSTTSNVTVTNGRLVVQGGRLRSSGFRVRVQP